MKTVVEEFLEALSFLTILPVPRRGRGGLQALGRSVVYFPLVGLLLGLFLVGFDRLFLLLFPPIVANALLLSSSLVLTGALHLDGLIDTLDALLGPGAPEERLVRLKDPRVGAFGVAGAFSLLLVKYGALLSLSPSLRAPGLLVAPTLGRWGMTYAIYAYPYKAGPGLGRIFSDEISLGPLLGATVIALVVALLTLQEIGAVAFLAGWLGTVAVSRFALRRIPGLTGDVYGAINEVVEVLVFLIAVSTG